MCKKLDIALEKAKFTHGNGISKTLFQMIFVFKDITAFDSVRPHLKVHFDSNKDVFITRGTYFYFYNVNSLFHLAPNRTI